MIRINEQLDATGAIFELCHESYRRSSIISSLTGSCVFNLQVAARGRAWIGYMSDVPFVVTSGHHLNPLSDAPRRRGTSFFGPKKSDDRFRKLM